ncbi:MAG: toll/interleukin-1 receptor domain-containing protein [Candidatus Udaeobacter sp.]
MARVFISYRRRDNPYVAGILRDALQGRFGIDEVFFDLDNIPLGVDFRQHISNAVGSCAVLLVVIGDQWLHLTDEQGRRRLEDPSDFVRIEIEAALKRDIPVVPVLIETAQMPAASELPESIRELTFRNAAEMRAGRDLKHHVERLVSGLAESLKARISRPAEEDSAPSEEEVPVAPKAREEITHQTKVKAAPPTPSVRPVNVADAQQLSPSVLQERAAFVEKARKAFEGVTNQYQYFYGKRYFAGTIPVEKATAATTAYAPHVRSEDIMLLYDASSFGGAKHGVLLTTDSIYWQNLWGAQGNCRYADIRAAIVNTNHSLLINGDKQIVVPKPIAQRLMKLLVELVPDLQPRGGAGRRISGADSPKRFR